MPTFYSNTCPLPLMWYGWPQRDHTCWKQNIGRLLQENAPANQLLMCLNQGLWHISFVCHNPWSPWFRRLSAIHICNTNPLNTPKWPPYHKQYFQMYLRECKLCILVKKILKFVPIGSVDNNPVIGWIMAWRRIGYKPLSESNLTRFTDSYMRNLREMN